MKNVFLAIGFALLVCGSGTAATNEQSPVDQFNNCLADPAIQNKPLYEQIDLIMQRSIAGKGN